MSSRRKIQDGTGVDTTLPNVGHLQAWGRGEPPNGRAGYAPSCLYHNISGTPGLCLYINVGNVFSSNWLTADGLIGADPYSPVPCRLRQTFTLTSLGAKYFTWTTIPAGSILRELFIQIVTTVTTSGTTAAIAIGDHAGSPVLGTGYPLTADLLKNTTSVKLLNGSPLASDLDIDVCGTVADGSALGNGNLTGGEVMVGMYFWAPPFLPLVS